MSEDLIKRSDAIEAIHNYWKKRLDTLPTADIQQTDKILEHNKTLCNFINAIPSADRPQGWISCSERMPEEDTPVLVAIKTKDRLPKWVEEQTYHYVTDIDVWDSDDGWYQHRAKIVAWMPLPKPWKGADDE